jgi:hypothetical protein
MLEFRSAVRIMGEATRFKTPHLADAAIKSVREFAEKEFAKHVKEGASGTVVLVLS